jgi:signal transduction histidine kinase/ActR/RegA family two-component response regulator
MEEHMRGPVKINRVTWDVLEMAACLGDFQTSVRHVHDTSAILRETRACVQKLIPFEASTFFIVNEANSEFLLADCEPETYRQFLQDEMDFLINNAMFAWASREKRAVIVSSRDYQKRLVLHVMATSSRTRGMFMGMLAQGERDIPHICLSLLSIVMLNSANALESYELYRTIEEINANLEKKVEKRTEELIYRVEFENLIASMSTTFINLAPDEIDSGINRALKAIGEFICADHGYAILLSEDGTRLDNGHEWCAEGVGPQIERFRELKLGNLPLLAESIERSEHLHIPSIAKLPLEIKVDNALLQSQGIQSLIVVPMVSGKAVIGLLGFDSVRGEKSWSDDTVALIKIVEEMLVNALERKWAEEEKKKLQAQLQQAQKMQAIGTMAGGIAHDFNNILFPIVGYTEMAMGDLPEDSLTRSNLEEVLKAADRAKGLVQQILTFSRQREQERKPLKIQPVIKEALTLIRASLPTTIEISQNIDKGCGAILADPIQIHQVMMNLCTNAYHAMREKGGVLGVTLTEVEIDSCDLGSNMDLKPGPYLRLTVSDTGHGMERAEMERIFEPYFTTKSPGEGAGMGLAVVHGVARSHGGYITVYSEPGKGAAFHVYLPRIDGIGIAPVPVSSEPAPNGTERILFTDDEKQIVDMVQQMLERLGYHVTARTSSVEALKAFRTQPDKFDLVITDQTMPNMTGAKLAQKIMGIRPDIPIILCTGFSEVIAEEKAKAMGFRDFVMKPIVKTDIAKIIRRVLDQENAK